MGRLDTSRSRAAHGYAVPGLLSDPGARNTNCRPEPLPPSSPRPPASLALPPREEGRPQPPLLRPRAVPARVSRPPGFQARGTGGKRAEGSREKQSTAGRNLLTGRYGEERSEKRKGQGREDVQALRRRRCRGGCRSYPVPPRSGPSRTGLLSTPTVCEFLRTRSRGLWAPTVLATIFPWILPTRVRLSSLPGLGKRHSDQRLFSLSVCPPIYLSVNELSSENIEVVFVFVRT